MKLETYSFSELEGTAKAWELKIFRMKDLNLVVGRNSSGKTRLINTITVLGQLLTRPPERLWKSGHWNVTFSEGQDDYELEIKVDDHEVKREFLKKGSAVLLERGGMAKERSTRSKSVEQLVLRWVPPSSPCT